jgi:hypothetical protein
VAVLVLVLTKVTVGPAVLVVELDTLQVLVDLQLKDLREEGAVQVPLLTQLVAVAEQDP